MKICDIYIYGFGKHCNRNFHFTDGVNVLSGLNESGKSTVMAFIHAALYGLSANGFLSQRSKYKPWNNEKYGGEMTFKHRGSLYRVTVVFGESKKNDSVTVSNETTGELIPIVSTVGETILGIPSEMFDLSMYAPQLSSKPELQDGNMDFLIGQITRRNAASSSSSETVVSKRLRNAMEALIPENDEIGILNVLRKKRERLLNEKTAIEEGESEAENAYTNLKAYEGELNVLKEQAEQEDDTLRGSSIKLSMELLSEREKITKIISKLNNTQEVKSEIDARSRKRLLPVNIICLTLIILSIVCIVLIDLPARVYDIGKYIHLFNTLRSSNVLYSAAFAGIAVFSVIAMFAFRMYGRRDTKELLEELRSNEQELCDALNIEYKEGNDEKIRLNVKRREIVWQKAEKMISRIDQESSEVIKRTERIKQLEKDISYTQAMYDSAEKNVSRYMLYQDVIRQLQNVEAQIKIYERRYSALKAAKKIADEAYEKCRSDIGPVFASLAGVYLQKLTEGAYSDMRISKNFDVSLRNREGKESGLYDSSYYSGATVDQIYLALRLALTKLISVVNDFLPIFLDDPFVQYDANRKRSAMTLIAQYCADNDSQIIIATCNLEDIYTGFNIITL